MEGYFLRRKKLGKGSTQGIRGFAPSIIGTVCFGKNRPDPRGDLLCIRWGCTANVAQKNVLNKAEAIHEVNDKKAFRLKTAKANLAPASWGTYIDWVADGGKLPVIIRPARHAQGRNVILCTTVDEVTQACRRFANYYISMYVAKTEEYRVFVAQGRAVWVAKKTPANPKDIAWNVARGGHFDNVHWKDWPCKAVKKSIEAFNLTELDFGGVDIMVDKKGDCFVLEINAAPSQTSPYRQKCVAKVFQHILKTGDKKKIPVRDNVKGLYLKFIHPALEGKAFV